MPLKDSNASLTPAVRPNPFKPHQGVAFVVRDSFGCSTHALSHGLNTSIPMNSKSRMLRIATAMPRTRAIAAIWPST